MSAPAHIRAPFTYELIQRINQILTSRGLTREGFREELNAFLPPFRRIKANHSGLVQVTRWLDPTGSNWSEPMGEIVLAMEKFVNSH